jgi:hypothetical protein
MLSTKNELGNWRLENKPPIKNKTLKFACAGTTGDYLTKVLIYFISQANSKKKKKTSNNISKKVWLTTYEVSGV